MSDTSGERLARQVRRACGPYNDPELPVVQIVLDLKEKADRLAAIERQVKEIAARLEHCDDSVSVQEVRPIGRELRAIIGAPEGESDE